MLEETQFFHGISLLGVHVAANFIQRQIAPIQERLVHSWEPSRDAEGIVFRYQASLPDFINKANTGKVTQYK